LYTYLERIKPLLDIEAQLEISKKEFEQKWNEGTFPGWPVNIQNSTFCIKFII
jgi:hypothetical protein